SSALSSVDPTHNCPASGGFADDYVKYSFTVATTGWYRLVARAQGGGFLTRVDDIDLGESGAGASWSDVQLTPAVHLTAGLTHVLAIEFRNSFDVGLDYV